MTRARSRRIRRQRRKPKWVLQRLHAQRRDILRRKRLGQTFNPEQLAAVRAKIDRLEMGLLNNTLEYLDVVYFDLGYDDESDFIEAFFDSEDLDIFIQRGERAEKAGKLTPGGRDRLASARAIRKAKEL